MGKRKKKSSGRGKRKNGNRTNRRSGWFSEDGLKDWQDENFYFIAGYTSWGFPYGITWEEERRIEEQEREEADPMDDPGYLEYLESILKELPLVDSDLLFPEDALYPPDDPGLLP